MYNLPCYKEPDARTIRELIDSRPFAFLSGCDARRQPVATQVPMFLEERDGETFLTGHLMKNTDHHRAFAVNPQVLAVFTGPDSYVSGSWYRDPNTPSTWNYMSVHARGSIRFLEGQALEDMLRKTSLHFENHDARSPTVYDNLPLERREKALKALVAFEIEVTELDHVFKLSQDQDAESYSNIIRQLEGQGGGVREVADEMRKRQARLFRSE